LCGVNVNVSLVDERVISLMFQISGCGLCIVGVVIHTNVPFGYFLSFLGQEGTKFKNYFIFRLHIWSTFNED